MPTPDALKKLDDREAEQCLDSVVKDWLREKPQLAPLVDRPSAMSSIIAEISKALGRPTDHVREVRSYKRPDAVRDLLATFAAEKKLAPRVERWLTARPRPVGTEIEALVLAGIVTALSTHMDIAVATSGEKKNFKLAADASVPLEKILVKFNKYFVY